MSSKTNSKFTRWKEYLGNKDNHNKEKTSSESNTVTLHKNLDEKGNKILSIEKISININEPPKKRENQLKLNEN